MRERIFHFIELLGLKQSDFCRECGIKTSTLSAMGEGFNTQNLARIARRYPDLNLRWLLLGDGEIWLNNGRETTPPTPAPSQAYMPQESPEIVFLRDMVSKQHDTIQILIHNIEKNYKPQEGKQ